MHTAWCVMHPDARVTRTVRAYIYILYLPSEAGYYRVFEGGGGEDRRRAESAGAKGREGVRSTGE